MRAGEQARAFLAMAACGAICAAIYDAVMLLRRALRAGRALTGLLDIAFGVLVAAGMTATALGLRIEPLRLYAFLGLLTGMGAWFATLGVLIRRLYALLANKSAGLRRQRR